MAACLETCQQVSSNVPAPGRPCVVSAEESWVRPWPKRRHARNMAVLCHTDFSQGACRSEARSTSSMARLGARTILCHHRPSVTKACSNRPAPCALHVDDFDLAVVRQATASLTSTDAQYSVDDVSFLKPALGAPHVLVVRRSAKVACLWLPLCLVLHVMLRGPWFM